MYTTIFSTVELPFMIVVVVAGAALAGLLLFLHTTKPRARLWVRVAGGTAVALLGALLTIAAYERVEESRRWSHAISTNTCETVAGTVEVVRQEPPGGHRSEIIRVADRTFEYSTGKLGVDYNKTLVQGGELDDGTRVRLCVVGTHIVKVEINRRDARTRK